MRAGRQPVETALSGGSRGKPQKIVGGNETMISTVEVKEHFEKKTGLKVKYISQIGYWEYIVKTVDGETYRYTLVF